MKQKLKIKNLKQLIQRLASLKITVICLTLFFILTAWGTIYQVENGLYQAQKRFFNSWVFLNFSWLPFPGAQAVIWVLSINLFCAALLLKFKFKLRKIGILFIHYGLILLLLSSFFSYYYSKESFLPLYEGSFSNLSKDYRKWELVCWRETLDPKKQIYAYCADDIKKEETIFFDSLNLKIVANAYFKNSLLTQNKALGNTLRGSHQKVTNQAIFTSKLKRLPSPKDPLEALPGFLGKIVLSSGESVEIVLWGGDEGPSRVSYENETFYFKLRRKSYLLPIVVKLLEFKKEVYQGTEIPKSYESLVEVTENKINRKVKIFMNHPFRKNDFTFYQSSFSVDALGREQSIFAVVKNKTRLFPYISSLLISLGLLIHFLIEFIRRSFLKRKTVKKKEKKGKHKR